MRVARAAITTMSWSTFGAAPFYHGNVSLGGQKKGGGDPSIRSPPPQVRPPASDVVVVLLLVPADEAVQSLAGAGSDVMRVPAAHVLLPDAQEGSAELLDAEGVDDGVDGGVAVREQDGHVEEDHGIAAVGAEERDAVEDVQREPAEGEEEEHQRQRLGQLQLLAVVAAGVRVAGRHLLVELPVDHVEDLGVDEDHEDERRQHPAEEVEVDHVVHADDVLEAAGDDQVAVLRAVLPQAVQVVPAQHGRQAHHEGDGPAQDHRRPGTPLGHHPLIAHGDLDP